MISEKILKEIMKKKEFSQLPKKDVQLAFEKFEKRDVSEGEKIRLTRELLHKVFSSFTSQKLLSKKNKPEEWILKKHLSTRERLPYYKQIYSRIFENLKTKASVIDLGAGVNAFSCQYLKEAVKNPGYLAIEGIGQLVDLSNDYFSNQKMKAKAIHISLFDLDEIKEIISKTEKPRVIFLFKTIDSLEMLKRDYSMELIKEIMLFADLIVVSFPVESMIKRRRFKVSRKWVTDFIEENFKVKDDFEIGGERYICFAEKSFAQ